MNALPEEEIKKELLVLADRAGKAYHADLRTREAEFTAIEARKKTLVIQYTSYASPDRKTMFDEAKQTLRQSGAREKGKPLGESSLINYMLERGEKGGDAHYREQILPCGAALTPIACPGGNGFELSLGGQPVLSYTGGMLSYFGTPEEQARQTEFISIYNKAYYAARSAYGAATNQSNLQAAATAESGSGFDVTV
jgi:hypothetical protein